MNINFKWIYTNIYPNIVGSGSVGESRDFCYRAAEGFKALTLFKRLLMKQV